MEVSLIGMHLVYSERGQVYGASDASLPGRLDKSGQIE
jgi:hypothetical protein